MTDEQLCAEFKRVAESVGELRLVVNALRVRVEALEAERKVGAVAMDGRDETIQVVIPSDWFTDD